jgi:hypothetical protein
MFKEVKDTGLFSPDPNILLPKSVGPSDEELRGGKTTSETKGSSAVTQQPTLTAVESSSLESAKLQHPHWGVGNKRGVIGPQTIWEMIGPVKDEWEKLEPRIEDLVGQTPTKSKYEITPAVVLNGLMIGYTAEDATPTVLVSSTSESYASHLKKAIQRNGMLDTTAFDVMALDSHIPKVGSEHEIMAVKAEKEDRKVQFSRLRRTGYTHDELV